VLESLLELKDFKARYFELEDTTTQRIAELVSDESEKESKRHYEKEVLQQRFNGNEKIIQTLTEKARAGHGGQSN
jgi:hypothetical protein